MTTPTQGKGLCCWTCCCCCAVSSSSSQPQVPQGTSVVVGATAARTTSVWASAGTDSLRLPALSGGATSPEGIVRSLTTARVLTEMKK